MYQFKITTAKQIVTECECNKILTRHASCQLVPCEWPTWAGAPKFQKQPFTVNEYKNCDRWLRLCRTNNSDVYLKLSLSECAVR